MDKVLAAFRDKDKTLSDWEGMGKAQRKTL